MVVAEIVGLGAGAVEHPTRCVGRRHLFDLRKIRWCTVGKRFAQLLAPGSAPSPAMSIVVYPTEQQAVERMMGLASCDESRDTSHSPVREGPGIDERDQT